MAEREQCPLGVRTATRLVWVVNCRSAAIAVVAQPIQELGATVLWEKVGRIQTSLLTEIQRQPLGAMTGVFVRIALRQDASM